MSATLVAELSCDVCLRRYNYADDGASGDTESIPDTRREAKERGWIRRFWPGAGYADICSDCDAPSDPPSGVSP